MYKDNKGFSLVELIIVVAIIALFAGIAGYGLSLSSGKAADECARKLASSIQRTRTSTMGKYKTTIRIWKDADGVWTEETITMAKKDAGETDTAGTEGEKVTYEKIKVGSKNVNVTYGDSELTNVIFEFDRSSGALKKINDENVSGAEVVFKVSKASTVKKVVIVPFTGRVTVE